MIRIHSPRVRLARLGTIAGAATLALVIACQAAQAQPPAPSDQVFVKSWVAAEPVEDVILIAQDEGDQKAEPGRRRAGAATGFSYMAGDMEVAGKVVTGAPYSGEAVTEMIQTLADGNRIVRKQTASVARDSQGRTRRDMVVTAIGPWVPEQTPKITFIQDPVAGVLIHLDEQRQTAMRSPLPTGGVVAMGGAAFGAGQPSTTIVSSERRQRANAAAGSASATNAPPPPPPPPGSLDGPQPPMTMTMSVGGGPATMMAFAAKPEPGQTEPLGTQTIEGVEATGSRTTVTIPAGEIGNEQAIKIVSEQWYSKDLQMIVMSKRDDPRVGETIYRMTNLSRAEPAATLFEVPAGYTIVDEPKGGMRFKVERDRP